MACKRAIEADRNFANPYGLGAARSRTLARLDEARSSVKAGLALRPSFSIAAARAFAEALSDNPTYRAGLEPLMESMRMAGVPEQ